MSRTAWLVRHGRAVAPVAACIGWSDPPLAEPAATAEAMGRLAARIGWPCPVYASDLQRARHTGEALAAALGVSLQIDPRLREMHFGDWEGLTWGEIAARDASRCDSYLADWHTAQIPGGESVQEVIERSRMFAADLPDTACLIVGHAGALRILASQLLGCAVGDTLARPLPPGHFCHIEGDRVVAWAAAP